MCRAAGYAPAMRRMLALLTVVVAVAACDAATAPAGPETSAASTTAAPTVTTTTQRDAEQECREVADRLSGLLEDILDELDEMDAAAFTDRSTWPEDLLALETVGVELDRASAELGCDPAQLQAVALAAVADRQPRSLLSRWLLELLEAP